jgi:glycosyltransferase involved in cell wall biosynthesis
LISTTPGSNRPWGFEELDTGVGTIGVHLGKWTSDGKTHDGKKVANAIFTLANKHKDNHIQGLQTVSVVVPVLDEAGRLPSVLEKLLAHDWLMDGVIPEFIVVDGGSADATAQIASNFPGVHLIEMNRGAGRGEALSAGIAASRGEFIVTFPGDDEYQLDAIESVVRTLRAHESQVVFGSRVGLCVDSDQRLRNIYGGRTRTYFLSKWGGISLSLLSGLLWRRWVADVLTSVKGFRREYICQLTLNGFSADWDARVIVDASRLQIAIAEVPVQFSPRTLAEGKKIRTRDGVRALRVLLVERFK